MSIMVCVESLLGGSKVNMENKQRATALMTAVGMGKHEAAQFLLDSGADVNKVRVAEVYSRCCLL